MTKICRFENFQHTFSFNSQIEELHLFYNCFLEDDLDNTYLAIPWDSLVDTFALLDSKKGPVSLLPFQGKLVLIFLKHYPCCSDKRLIPI